MSDSAPSTAEPERYPVRAPPLISPAAAISSSLIRQDPYLLRRHQFGHDRGGATVREE